MYIYVCVYIYIYTHTHIYIILYAHPNQLQKMVFNKNTPLNMHKWEIIGVLLTDLRLTRNLFNTLNLIFDYMTGSKK